MPALRLLLADQLSMSIASLKGIDKHNDIVMLAEVMEEATYVKHHKKKIAFLFAAMRHFAEELREQGFNVCYTKLDDLESTASIVNEIQRNIKKFNLERVILTQPGEYRLLQEFQALQKKLHIDLEIRDDDRFLASIAVFEQWAQGKQQLRMEFFYRELRKHYHILLEPDGSPVGGKWNYDKENRKPPAKSMQFPQRLSHPISTITKEVLQLVAQRFGSHFGTLEPFQMAVTRADALNDLRYFIDYLLPHFGDYQDAMVADEPYLYHSAISIYLNAGLLLPLEVCQLAEQAYFDHSAPLNAVEGFIRQILGWREYVRGIYWLYMPDYAEKNYFAAQRKLPNFYWDADTDMFCLAEAVRHTRDHAYSHHIQRLMITGNFALLAGINPVEVCEWYLLVYADAYEWVELPNTLGMALYGDGGLMASKPYAASGKYIKRMSNYCQHCQYNPELTVGDKACPFNALYWDFLDRNSPKLRRNLRLNYAYATWDRMAATKQQAIRQQAAVVLEKLDTDAVESKSY